MSSKTPHALVILYLIATIILLVQTTRPTKTTKYEFLLLGIVGQILLFVISYHIYQSHQIWSSFYMYALIYVLYILSFTSIDVYFYLTSSLNFTGKIFKRIRRMFVDFMYVNFSTVSTMGYSDITPNTTATRAYSSYKIAVAIFMIVFLVTDITIKN